VNFDPSVIAVVDAEATSWLYGLRPNIDYGKHAHRRFVARLSPDSLSFLEVVEGLPHEYGSIALRGIVQKADTGRVVIAGDLFEVPGLVAGLPRRFAPDLSEPERDQ
jgi:hypothetical protein